MTPQEHYRYRLHIRIETRKLHLMGRLFQQYYVDAYIIEEQTKLQFYRNQQSNIRVELYTKLMDVIEDVMILKILEEK